MGDQDPPQPHRDSRPEPGEQHRLADFLRRHREDILSDWQQSLRLRHPEQDPGGALLRDHMPQFLDRLAEAVEHPHGEQPPQQLQAITDEHALQRLELGYEPGEVALEYGLLRSCILRRLERDNYWPTFTELELLDEAIDQGVIHAITSYAQVRERMLQALERVSQAALESEDVDTFLPKLLKVLMEVDVAVDAASILLREGEDRLRVRAAEGLGAEEGMAANYTLRIGEGLTGKVAAERRPLTLRSVSNHPDLAYDVIRRLGIRAAYSVPLLHGETLVGVAHMSSTTVYDFSESDKLLFRAMVNRATGFIVQAELAQRERLARAEAQSSLALLNTLLEASPVGIGFVDRELRYLRINETLAEINGHPVAFHLGKTVREVLPGWISDTYEPLLRQVLATGQPVTNHEFVSKPRDGTGPPRHWLGNYYPVRAENGEVLGLGCVVVDITRQKAVEAELRHSGELREQLIAVLGHDLRNPLNAITASAFLLQRTEDLSAGAQRAVERIRNSAGRMARMLSDILDFARSSMGGGLPVHRERVNLHDICRSTLEELQVANPGRRLELDVQGDGVGCWDADRLAQVVGNLVGNALQHGRPDTPVRVEVRDAGSDVYLHVHNEGEPIPPELQAMLFQPFRRGTTGKAATRSVGLGLYIVRQVAQAHGGSVEVHSAQGEGTTFTVRLPRGITGGESKTDPW
ncbi:ATP-binding protein [Vitiosangium sp. GDMCC 1.1324]|uniref:ATP-binding protein n=1 Tax=Vitiosangium sp. (strain GDMCC 1.1324) TaxID=2138576 RepID=UPI000D36EB78|nr:ATP-binding protein [Vitiosangium sp. GDMCC 1.1324]PTL83293.1 histidine kinase [Vitiosangium sp. GDMCC 1.1324]